jgi:hypothetical protein
MSAKAFSLAASAGFFAEPASLATDGAMPFKFTSAFSVEGNKACHEILTFQRFSSEITPSGESSINRQHIPAVIFECW